MKPAEQIIESVKGVLRSDGVVEVSVRVPPELAKAVKEGLAEYKIVPVVDSTMEVNSFSVEWWEA